MAVVHFLNVGEGDCSIIHHDTGNVTVIDICNAHRLIKSATPNSLRRSLLGGLGNYNQRNNSTNKNRITLNNILKYIISQKI